MPDPFRIPDNVHSTRSDLTYLWLWLAASGLAVFFASLFSAASLTGDGYIPVGNDSFYHARRILDAVSGDPGFYQFDPAIHAPEGSWLTWPWAYDYLASRVVLLLLFLGLTEDPGTALAFLPVGFAPVNIGLLVLVLRSAGIRPASAAVALVAFALSPLNQGLHGVGVVDHHFVELSFVLVVTWLGLRWAERPDVRSGGILLGLALGAAPAFHNGLFILQLPCLLAVGMQWLRGRPVDRRACDTLAASLVLACLLFLLPASTFWDLRFEFTTHSWFHLYVAASSAIVLVLLSRISADRQGWAIVAIAAVSLALPVITEAGKGASFLAGATTLLDQVTEVYSPYRMFAEGGGAMAVAKLYSWLILLAPLFLLVAAWQWVTAAELPQRMLMASASIGLALLLLQFRLHPFGFWALLVVGVWLLQGAEDRLRYPSLGSVAIGLLVVVFAYQPPLRNQLFELLPAGLSAEYAVTRPLYRTLENQCASSPGVVLAGTDDGHPIRYHSDCSVIANNFLLTRQHGEKVLEVQRLMGMTPDALRHDATRVDYVLVRLNALFTVGEEENTANPVSVIRAANPPLANALTTDTVPEGFELIDELRTGDERKLPFARLLRVIPPSSDTPSIANPGS